MKSNALLLALTVGGLSVGSSSAITIYGLGTNGSLYSFDSASPQIFSPAISAVSLR